MFYAPGKTVKAIIHYSDSQNSLAGGPSVVEPFRPAKADIRFHTEREACLPEPPSVLGLQIMPTA